MLMATTKLAQEVEVIPGDKIEIKGSDYQAKVELSFPNQRIVIKDYQGPNLEGLKDELIASAPKEITKIWIKARKQDEAAFQEIGFEKEAEIARFYPDDDASLLAYYLSSNRKQQVNKEEKDEILASVRDLNNKEIKDLAQNCEFKLATRDDLSDLADLYDDVFLTYPYPINNPFFLRKMMNQGVIYGLVYQNKQLVAAASAETVAEYKNAEMTDFATRPEARGQGLASYILAKLEQELKDRDYNCLYTIARAKVYGINKIFSQAEYEYTGTLVKNCNIAGGLEDMNLWQKRI